MSAMDCDQLLSSIHNLAHCGVILSIEERANIQSSLDLAKTKYAYKRILFWGVIQCLDGKYYIAQGIKDNPLQKHTCLYSKDCVSWGLLPTLSPTDVEFTENIRGLFTGDPSFESQYIVKTVQKKSKDADQLFSGQSAKIEQHVTVLKEEQRLAATIFAIDRDVAIVPRGYYAQTPRSDDDIIINRSFTGLTLEQALQPSHYVHFQMGKLDARRKPPPFNVVGLDFMDSIEKEAACGEWVIKPYRGSSLVMLHNLRWEGFHFYLLPDSSTQFGGIYYGWGERNLSLPHMLPRDLKLPLDVANDNSKAMTKEAKSVSKKMPFEGNDEE